MTLSNMLHWHGIQFNYKIISSSSQCVSMWQCHVLELSIKKIIFNTKVKVVRYDTSNVFSL